MSALGPGFGRTQIIPYAEFVPMASPTFVRAVEMAELFPHVRVLGLDLAKSKPPYVLFLDASTWIDAERITMRTQVAYQLIAGRLIISQPSVVYTTL